MHGDIAPIINTKRFGVLYEFCICHQVFQVLVNLPVLDVHLCLKGWWEGGAGKEETKIINTLTTGQCLNCDCHH